MEKNRKKCCLTNRLMCMVLLAVALLTPFVVTGEAQAKSGVMEVHFIDVGQGDSTLIKLGDHAMLIDAGGNSKGTAVQMYLQKQGIKKLDYVVATHPDEDHAGGVDVVITKFDVGKVIYPNVSSDTATWRDVLSAMKYKYLKQTVPVVGQTYRLGDAKFTILSPGRTYSSTNESSVCLRLVYKNTSFMFVGDSEKESQADMISSGLTLKSTVYKAAHHGSSYGTTQAFFNKVAPKYTVISCGQDNKYGHPNASVLSMIKSGGSQLFRTDVQGSIVAKTNGRKLTWSANPTTNWNDGNSGGGTGNDGKEEENSQPSGGSVVYKTATGSKYHAAGCQYLKSSCIKITVEQAKAEGLEPCSVCHPATQSISYINVFARNAGRLAGWEEERAA